MPNRQHRVVFAPDVVLQVIDGEALILKLDRETVFALNRTGARIAQLIESGNELSAVVNQLAFEYQRDRRDIERDVTELINVLLSKELVVPVDHNL
jgi:hypothetical protein